MMNQGGVSDTRTTLDLKFHLRAYTILCWLLLGSMVRWQEKELLNSHE
ncbi:hypothetical protein HanRHA438_Chr16g0784741 [Helianthus annuus]|nr:hypothetical protein HanIR_Chr16g0840201 [Helianthus annuus]KAJ0462339.1 hypothetical protein HanHA89_Chr16g0682321 [Helianthus annuus]KAJ0646616.1 hypothetical protein HanOQP8_Chr16g0637161 [Helianthus annuus]KAJ0838047.1 hypothetical protein HanRHA438_Chr16g0784741 [Helianthus annuus]